MRKDWKKIADVIDKPLRQLLISAKGLITQSLAKGFPEYFISDNRQQEPLTREEILQIAKDAPEIDNLIEMLKQMRIPYKRRDFTGLSNSVRPSTISKSGGRILTWYGDWVDLFWRSSQEQGQTLEHDEKTWLVLWNSYDSGGEGQFARHSLIIVPVDAFPALKNEVAAN